VNHGVRLDAVENRKSLLLGIESWLSILQPVAILTAIWALRDLYFYPDLISRKVVATV
jgi:hypothetical protein